MSYVMDPTDYELEHCEDLKLIEHPAFYIGQKDLYLFFQDDHDEIFFLKREEEDSEDLFDIGVAIDAEEAVPVQADPKAEELAMEVAQD